MAEQSVTITLTHPIPGRDGKDVTEIAMRTRLKVKDLEFLPDVPDDLSENEAKQAKVRPAQMLPLLASLTDLPLSSINEIDIEDDFPKITSALTDFISAMSQKIGASSSGA